MSADPVTFGYPVLLDLHGVPVLVVGAGPVAVRKIAGLVAAGADVRVVAPESTSTSTGTGSASSASARYESGDLDGMRLVVTATGVDGGRRRRRRRRPRQGHLGQRRRSAGRLSTSSSRRSPARARSAWP